MKRVLTTLLVLGLGTPVWAGALTSEYTDLNTDACKVLDKAAEGEGAWVNLECPGFKDYKVYVSEDDARQSATYGYEAKEPAWESFGGFNKVGPKIEWRLDDGVPFAAIHRWFVAGADGELKTEVLAVETIGQMSSPGGCAVALVLASGNPQANDQARKIADEKSPNFKCGIDQAERIGKVPEFGREAP